MLCYYSTSTIAQGNIHERSVLIYSKNKALCLAAGTGDHRLNSNKIHPFVINIDMTYKVNSLELKILELQVTQCIVLA